MTFTKLFQEAFKFPSLVRRYKAVVFNSLKCLLYYILQVHWQPHPLVFRHAHTCKIPVWAQYSSTWVSELPTFHFWPLKHFFHSLHFFLHLQSRCSILDLEILHLEYLCIKICVYIWGTALHTWLPSQRKSPQLQ